MPKYTTLHLTPLTVLNLCVIFDEHLTFSDQITSLSPKPVTTVSRPSTSLYAALFQFLNCLPSTVVTSTVYSKLDCCNSFYYKLFKSVSSGSRTLLLVL